MKTKNNRTSQGVRLFIISYLADLDIAVVGFAAEDTVVADTAVEDTAAEDTAAEGIAAEGTAAEGTAAEGIAAEIELQHEPCCFQVFEQFPAGWAS